MTDQDIPSESKCPDCGAKPTTKSIQEVRLSDLGYKHRDVFLDCSNCSESWTHGVPIGEDGEDDLRCDSCESEYMRVHRVRVSRNAGNVDLHLKCPNCYYFKRTNRDTDSEGVALIGYDDITGGREDAEPYGYN